MVHFLQELLMRLEELLGAIENLSNDEFIAVAEQIDLQRKKRPQSILRLANAQASILTGELFSEGSKRGTSLPRYCDPHSRKTWSVGGENLSGLKIA